MVCLTSCVFRSIRFSGFARPHIGVRREGELYTQAQGGGKGVSARAQDGHKLGNNRRLGGFPGRTLAACYSQAFSARNFSSGSISMLSSGMGSDFMRLRPRNSLAAMAAKISAKPLIILTVIASL